MPVYYGIGSAPPGLNPGGGRQPGGASPSLWDIIKSGVGIAAGNPTGFHQTPPSTSFQSNHALRDTLNLGGGPIGSGLGLPQPGSMDSILAKLEELQNPGRYQPSMGMIEAQARAQAGAQYDPVIARLRNQMGVAETRANRNKGALGEMFGQLSSNIAGDIPKIDSMYQGAEQKSAGQYAGLKQAIQDQYAKSQADQESMMQRLNIQAAAPDAMKQQSVDQNYFTDLAAKEGQTQQAALGQEQRGAVDYTRKGSEMALSEGTNRQADLMYQLQDLLAQYQGQIGEAETGKNSSYLSTLYGLQNQGMQQAQDKAQRDFENYIKVLNVGQSLQKAGTALNVQSPADVGKRMLGMGLPASSAQNIQSVFMSALSSDPMIQAGIDSNFGQALPKEALAARVVEQGRSQGLSSQELNALQVAALEYFGRR